MRQHIYTLLRPATAFWPMWCVLTAVVAISTAWIFRSSPVKVLRDQEDSGPRQFDESPTVAVSLVIITLFLCAYAAMILAGEDFAMYDNWVFTAFSLRGVNRPLAVSLPEGRFWPLGFQEFNIIGHFTRTITGYHAFAIFELGLFVLLLLNLSNQLRIASRVTLVILTLITPAVVLSFTSLIYPERNILVLLVCLALSVKLFEQTRSTRWAVAAVVSAQVMLYLKEPVFLLLLTFATARVVLRIRTSSNTSWSFRRVWDKENRLDLCIAAVSIIFALVFFALLMLPQAGTKYLVGHRVSLAEAARYYLNVDLLAWTLAAVATVRMYRILRRGVSPSLLWDGLAWGGVAYFGAYLGLRMKSSYYLAPVDLVAVLYLGHLLYSSWGGLRFGVRVLAASVALFVVCQALALSTFQVLERKFIIRQKSAMARLILETYHREPGSVFNLYFPLTSPYMLSEFASYLSYRGLPVEEQENDGAVRAAGVRIFAAKIPKDGRCLNWRTFVCHAGMPDPANLVIVLPNDAGPEEWELYRAYAEKLHAYDPRTRPPDWMVRTLGFLRAHGAR